MKELTAIDLCCGAGGWACAARGLPIRIVAGVDMWEACCRTHELNHPATRMISGDLRDPAVRAELISAAGRPDIIIGAIPCEWLSTRRSRAVGNPVTDEEQASERETLAAVLGIVAELSPAFWCLEDVKGLAKELPPDIPWLELNSTRFSAQRRKRIYVGQFPAPIFRSCGQVLGDKLRSGPFRIGRRSADRKLATSEAFSLDLVYAVFRQKKAPTVCNLSSRRDAELVVVDDEIAGGRRQLEWQEAAALQGFPEDYVFYGSPSDAWKMIGQAIQIDTGRAILEEIVRHSAEAAR